MKTNQNPTIGTFLKQIKREVILDNNTTYKLLGVKWYGKGAFVREEKTGGDIKAKKLYRVKTGDFIYNRLFAWKSSFAIIEKEFDGCLVSNEFPVFTYDQTEININYLLDYILLPSNIDYVNRMSKGVSGISRNRFKERIFLDMKIPGISTQKQNRISSQTHKSRCAIAELEDEVTRQQSLLKKIRQSILHDAISGKLTEQWRRDNSHAEPASELLKRIKAEKDRLVKAKKIKRQKPLPPITEDEIPFELPKGWVWAHIEDFNLLYVDCPHSTPKYTQNGYLCVLSQNITDNGLNFDSAKFVDQKEYEKRVSRLVPQQGDIIYIREGGRLGISSIIDCKEPLCLGQRVMLFRSYSTIGARFLNYFLKSQVIWSHINKSLAGAASPRINIKNIVSYLIPVPPFDEQREIIKKLDYSFEYLSRIEIQISNAQQNSEMLMQVVIKEAFNA